MYLLYQVDILCSYLFYEEQTLQADKFPIYFLIISKIEVKDNQLVKNA